MKLKRMYFLVLISLFCISFGTSNKIGINRQTSNRNDLKNDQKPSNQTEFWITINSEAAKYFSKPKVSSRTISTSEGSLSLLKVNQSSLSLISQMVDQTRKGFGDYVVHQSLEDANQCFNRINSGDKSDFVAPEINNRNVVMSLLNLIDSRNMLWFNKHLVNNYWNRNYKSIYGVQASRWIQYHWKMMASYALAAREDIEISGWDHSGFPQQSVIVTIKGTDEVASVGNSKNGRIIIGAHLDSINQYAIPPQENAYAPGADDNASGLAVLNEVLHAIVQSGYRPKKTIQIIGFAGEEYGLLGSQHIVSTYKQEGIMVEGMLNIDMAGYKGRGKDIYISTDFSNLKLAWFLANLTSVYLPNLTHDYMTCGGPCSDHVSWFCGDYPAAMASEAKGRNDPDTFNPAYHSEYDQTVDAEKMKNYAALAVAFVAELAKGEIQ